MALSQEVKRLRTAAGLSQKKLADAVGVSQAVIAQIETGVAKDVKGRTLFKLAAALGVDCSHFAEFFQDEAKPGKKRNTKSKAT